MDSHLAQVSLDLSNRPYLYFDIPFSNPQVGGMDTEMFEEFFRALAVNAGMTLHISILHGKNNHHMIEAAFKAFARALGSGNHRSIHKGCKFNQGYALRGKQIQHNHTKLYCKTEENSMLIRDTNFISCPYSSGARSGMCMR